MSIKLVRNYGWCMHQEVWSYGSLIETIHEWLVNRDSGKKNARIMQRENNGQHVNGKCYGHSRYIYPPILSSLH